MSTSLTLTLQVQWLGVFTLYLIQIHWGISVRLLHVQFEINVNWLQVFHEAHVQLSYFLFL